MTPRLPPGSPDPNESPKKTPRLGRGSPRVKDAAKKGSRKSGNWSDMIIGANDAKNPFRRIKDADREAKRSSLNWADLKSAARRPGSEGNSEAHVQKRPGSARLPSAYAVKQVGALDPSDSTTAPANPTPTADTTTKRRSLGHRLSTGGLDLIARFGQENAALQDMRFPVEDDIEFENTIKRSNSVTEAADPKVVKKGLGFADDNESPSVSHFMGSDNASRENSGARSVNRSGRSGRSGRSARSAASLGPEGGYPPLRQAMLVLVGIYLAIFLIALDRTIIGTAIPRMTDDFESFDDIGWYQSSYMLTLAAFQLFFGRFYTFYSPKWTYLLAIALFEIGSAICGAASSSAMFIVGRAIAGIGSAGTFSGSMVLLMNLLPLHQRAVAMGLIGACFGVSSVVGPLLGGAFTTYATWRWCFYINLPIGGITMLIVLAVVRVDRPMAARGKSLREKMLQLDPLGNILFIISVICLLLALQWGGTVYAWSNARIIVLLIVFAISFGAWIASQLLRSKDRVLIPRHVMRNRSILAGMWYAFFCNPAMVVSALYLPVYFQAIKGVNAVESGIRIIPLILGMVVMIAGSGFLTSKIGYYTPFMIAGSILAPIGTGLLTTLTPSTANGAIIGFQVLTGFGIGLGIQQSMLAAQTVLPRRDGPQGSSLMILCQMLGGSIFASVAQSVLEQKLVANIETLRVPGLDVTAIVNTGATTVKELVPAAYYPQFLAAYSHAITSALTVSVATACLSLFGALAMEWKSTKNSKTKMSSSGHAKSAALAGSTTGPKGAEKPVVIELSKSNTDVEAQAGKEDKDLVSVKSAQSRI